jgi:hypothetical protein
MNRLLLPTPTPQDIEMALTAMRDGTKVYGRWMRFSNYVDHDDEADAEADRLWWVTIVQPDGNKWQALGGGNTSADAAAVAWISIWLRTWWWQPGLSEEDDAKVPRRVPDGWQFELYDAPGLRPCLCN